METTELQEKLQGAYGEYYQDVAEALGVTQEELANNGIKNMN
jgi:hypothetical protein